MPVCLENIQPEPEPNKLHVPVVAWGVSVVLVSCSSDALQLFVVHYVAELHVIPFNAQHGPLEFVTSE